MRDAVCSECSVQKSMRCRACKASSFIFLLSSFFFLSFFKKKAFIVGLQTDFPHTVHTLLRSGDKLCMPITYTADIRQTCPLCGR